MKPHSHRLATSLRILLLSTPIGLLGACANQPIPPMEISQTGPHIPYSAQTSTTDTLTANADAYLAAADTSAFAHSAPVSDEALSVEPALEEPEMTTLVIETPKTRDQTHLNAPGEAEFAFTQEADTPAHPQETLFYYGFNKSELDEPGIQLIEQHGAYLAANPHWHMTIEGHADALGNPEYNQKLALKRATKIANILKAQGARNSQITVKSWGSDQPVVSTLHYGENRRVALLYDKVTTGDKVTTEDTVTTEKDIALAGDPQATAH